ncbi:MAG: hypothetical protein ACE5HF_07015 [Gemmatimonadota bacterium]
MIRQLRLAGLSLAVTAFYGFLYSMSSVEPVAAGAVTTTATADSTRAPATDPIRVEAPDLGAYAIDLADAVLAKVSLEPPAALLPPPLPEVRMRYVPCRHGPASQRAV